MTLINKLTNIANSIRAKTGDNSLLTLDEMATKIQNINTNNDTNNINVLDKWYAYNFGIHSSDYTVYDCVYLHKDYVTSPPQYASSVTVYKYTNEGFVVDNTTSDYGVYMQSNGVLFYHGAGYGHIPELDIITYSPQQTFPANR